MNADQYDFIGRLHQSIEEHFTKGDSALVACLRGVYVNLPDNPTAAISSAIEDGLDSWFITELKRTFG